MTSEEITYEKSADGVATITLNRPQTLNALTTAMATDLLPAMCREASDDNAVRAVVLTGAGTGFCSGAHVRERIPDVVGGTGAKGADGLIGGFVLPLWRIPKPVIAAVNGVAAGGGFSLACAADFRFAASTARFVAAFVRRGLMPDSGLTALLPRLVSRSIANRLLFTGGELTAHEALDAGLVDEVIDRDALLGTAHDFAARLAGGPAVALSFTKRALQVSADLERHLEFESWGQSICFTTPDFAEGIAAFTEKRPARFGGV